MATRPLMQTTTPAFTTVRPPSTTSVAAQLPVNTIWPSSGVPAAIQPPVGTQPPAVTQAASQPPVGIIRPPSGVPVANRPPVGTQPPATAQVTVQPSLHFQLPVMSVPPPNNAAYMTPQPGSSGTQAQRPVSTHNLTMYQAFNVGEVAGDVSGRSLNDTTYIPETSYDRENHDPNATFRPDPNASFTPNLNETVRPDPNATFRPEDHQTETLDTMVANNDLTIRQLIPNPELARGTIETVISAPENMARGACVSSIYTPYRDSGAVRPPLPGIPAGSFATPTGPPMHAPNITMTPMLCGAATTGLASWAPSQATVSNGLNASWGPQPPRQPLNQSSATPVDAAWAPMHNSTGLNQSQVPFNPTNGPYLGSPVPQPPPVASQAYAAPPIYMQPPPDSHAYGIPPPQSQAYGTPPMYPHQRHYTANALAQR
jgi:hypothetical protein